MFRELRAGADTATETERALTALRQRLDEARRSAVEFGFAVADIDRATRAAFERDVQRALRAIEDPVGLALELHEATA